MMPRRLCRCETYPIFYWREASCFVEQTNLFREAIYVFAILYFANVNIIGIKRVLSLIYSSYLEQLESSNELRNLEYRTAFFQNFRLL